jgi:TatD DNase family protein
VQGVDSIVDLLDRPDVVAVGEAGLDYFYEHSPRDVQRTEFAAQIHLAHERRLPLVIHSREAWDDTFDVLDAEGVPATTIFHCFTGGPAEARACLDRGALLSFSGIVTFPSAADVQEAARICPLDSMLVETDAPYLAPVPHRGSTNRPAWVVDVGTFVADLRGIAVSDLADATTRNGRRAFGLSPT